MSSPSSIDHEENFPVASWLCPPRLRAPIAAIYHFARTADDIADEGQQSSAERLQALAQFRQDFLAAASSNPKWQPMLSNLAQQIQLYQLPVQPLLNLLDAFEQDVLYTAQQKRYANMDELIGYCERSANPVGRLLLHLYGVNDAQALQQSDDICTALQLINFWQDLSEDLPRMRHYVPLHLEQQYSNNRMALLNHLLDDAQTRMLRGQALVHKIPGRAGWELRLVVQGGLRVLQKVRQLGPKVWTQRPTLSIIDSPMLLWRALLM
jgi:squalene synthase HpnC